MRKFVFVFAVVGCNTSAITDGGAGDGNAPFDAGACAQLSSSCTQGAICHQPSCYACFCNGHISGYTRLPGETDDSFTCRDGGWVKENISVDCFGLGRFSDSTCTMPKDAGPSWSGTPCPVDASADSADSASD